MMMKKPVLSLKARALRYLSQREHSRLELARKLSAYCADPDELEALLNWLEGAKFLSNARFSESLVHRRAARYGNQRILAELNMHQIEGEALSQTKADLLETEKQRALVLLHKKFSRPPDDALERAQYSRYLQQRGFTSGAIQFALGQDWKADLE